VYHTLQPAGKLSQHMGNLAGCPCTPKHQWQCLAGRQAVSCCLASLILLYSNLTCHTPGSSTALPFTS
jgi:hypothetical protein